MYFDEYINSSVARTKMSLNMNLKIHWYEEVDKKEESDDKKEVSDDKMLQGYEEKFVEVKEGEILKKPKTTNQTFIIISSKTAGNNSYNL